MHPSENLSALLDTAVRAAERGGALLLERYGKPHDIAKKGTVNLVTEADLASEAAIAELLRRETPDIPIMSEEQAESHRLNHEQALWVVDPLDGTTNFAHGFPFFAVSIALLQGGQALVGAVYAPLLGELFTACRGGGARLNGEPIHVSTESTLLGSLVATGFPYEREAALPGIMANLHRVLAHAQDVRRGGSAAIDLAYVACGRQDAYYEVQLKPWDSAAGWLLVTEAGGRVSGMDGSPYSPFVPHILATNGRVHEDLQPLLQLAGG